MLDAAVAMAESGWSIFPCHWPVWKDDLVMCSCGKKDCANRGKHPRTPHGFLDATTDVDRIARYWHLCPEANIGLATGQKNNITVLDVDPRHAGDRSLAALVARHGDLPETWRSRTGSGGEHIIFEYVAGVGSSANKLGAGLDIRGDGGLIIAPPSRHETGRHYGWINDGPIAEAPGWLAAMLVKEKAARAGAAPPEKWRSLFADGATEGGRNDAVVSLTGYLLSRRLDPFLVLDIVKLWNRNRLRPPLADEKIHEIVNWACGKRVTRR
jgi:Bifunctional DNA primase/polymerase, N-terminal/Primase C terminal 1 (PriCT-1)